MFTKRIEKRECNPLSHASHNRLICGLGAALKMIEEGLALTDQHDRDQAEKTYNYLRV